MDMETVEDGQVGPIVTQSTGQCLGKDCTGDQQRQMDNVEETSIELNDDDSDDDGQGWMDKENRFINYHLMSVYSQPVTL